MSGKLSRQIIVVTGAGRGLGRAIALGMAREGATVWICARTKPELEETASRIRKEGGAVEVRTVDLVDAGACSDFISNVLIVAGRVDVLVNNAAILDLLPIDQLDQKLWEQTLAVNLTAPFVLSKSVLPSMLTTGGSIINVSSRAGAAGFANEAAYCSSKFGLEGLTRALAVELSECGVSVNTITPGLKIKPTSITDIQAAERSSDEQKFWNDPAQLVPAFVWLSCLRGEVSGQRFDAHVLSRALRAEGFDISPDRAIQLAE